MLFPSHLRGRSFPSSLLEEGVQLCSGPLPKLINVSFIPWSLWTSSGSSHLENNFSALSYYSHDLGLLPIHSLSNFSKAYRLTSSHLLLTHQTTYATEPAFECTIIGFLIAKTRNFWFSPLCVLHYWLLISLETPLWFSYLCDYMCSLKSF